MAFIFTSVPAYVCVICYGESTPGLLHQVQGLYYSKCMKIQNTSDC